MKTILKTFGVVTGLIVIAAVLLPFLTEDPAEDATGLHYICENNLTQLSKKLIRYFEQNDLELYPPLSAEPGKLMWVSTVYPDYTPDLGLYVCPDGAVAEDLLTGSKQKGYQLRPELDVTEYIDDKSYFYLGYTLFDDVDMAAFARFYIDRMAKGLAVDVEIPLGQVKGVQSPFDEDPNLSRVRKIILGALEYHSLVPLRKHLRGTLLEDTPLSVRNHPDTVATLRNVIPLLIERPGMNHGKLGGNVLYLDGHIEFIGFPGKWPMTEKTIGLLLELDSLADD